jgi:hypothetical protein
MLIFFSRQVYNRTMVGCELDLCWFYKNYELSDYEYGRGGYCCSYLRDVTNAVMDYSFYFHPQFSTIFYFYVASIRYPYHCVRLVEMEQKGL